MQWCDYYEKINDWAVSTAVNKIASLEGMGEPDEIVDALTIIGYRLNSSFSVSTRSTQM